MKRTLILAIGFCVSWLLVGCGGATYVPVSGVVTMDGKPLPNAMVFFQPIGDSGGVGSTAKTDSDGRYKLEASTPIPTTGALVGKHRVTIGSVPSTLSNPNDSDAANPGGKAAPKLAKDTIPERYNTKSELEFDVPSSGTDKANFDLKSK
jgi:hypothetical protein